MHALIAPDKFKGSLTATQVAAALADGIATADSGWRTTCLPVADGGDGTVDAAIAAGWTPVAVTTCGPTGLAHIATYAVSGHRAVVELAAVVGLSMLPGAEPDPLGASTFGLGTVIAHAVDHGARDVVVGLGGSASTDGGAGMLQALGAKIVDAEGNPVGFGGGELLRATRVELSGLLPAVRRTRFRVACDVDNPLLGPHGATAVYGPQKGACPEDLLVLESAMSRWSRLVADTVGRDASDTPGAGAAGGTGFAMFAALGAGSSRGIELVLDLLGFETRCADVDLVITGEGCLDRQTLHGKAPAGVAEFARRRGIPVIAVAGLNRLDDEQLRRAGISAAYALTDVEPDPQVSIREAAALLRRLGRRIVRDHQRFSTINTRRGAS